MRLGFLFLIVTNMLFVNVWAAGNGGAHHGSVSDLIAPFVNVVLLAGFLIWKLKTPMSQHFSSMSEEVSSTLERANLKSKEAQILLDNEERKLASLPKEFKLISQHAETEVLNFEKNMAREVEDKTQKLKTDGEAKIRADKKALMDDLNNELINQVIKKTKTTIKTNKDYQNKVANKLLQGL